MPAVLKNAQKGGLSRLRRAIALTVLTVLFACQRVDIDALPAVPKIATESLLPAVQAQLTEAVAGVERDPGGPGANAHLAMVLQTYKQFNAAEAVYRRVRALEPNTFDWPYLHGIVLSALGRPDDAIDAYRAALAIRDDYPLAKVRLAELLADGGDAPAAARLYDDALSQPAPLSEAYFSHGKFLLRQGRVDQAIESFHRVLRLSGDFGAAHYQLGMAYRETGESALAARHLELSKRYQGASADSGDRILNRLLLLNQSDQPFVHRAKRLAEAGRFDEARRFIEMALARNPDSVAAHVSLVGMAATEGDFAKVDEHYTKAVALAPDNAKLHFNLGLARIAEQRYVEAQKAFERSLALDDSDPNTHVQLAILSERQEQRVLTERYLRKALALEPAHPFGNWLLGELLTQNGKADEALAYLRKALVAPHQLKALMFVALAKAEAQMGDWGAAFAALDEGRAAAAQSQDTSLGRRVTQVRRELLAQRDGAAVEGR